MELKTNSILMMPLEIPILNWFILSLRRKMSTRCTQSSINQAQRSITYINTTLWTRQNMSIPTILTTSFSCGKFSRYRNNFVIIAASRSEKNLYPTQTFWVHYALFRAFFLNNQNSPFHLFIQLLFFRKISWISSSSSSLPLSFVRCLHSKKKRKKC